MAQQFCFTPCPGNPDRQIHLAREEKRAPNLLGQLVGEQETMDNQ